MTLQELLIERINSLEDLHKAAVISINTHEIELSVEKNQKKMLAKQIAACKSDLTKIEENTT